MQGKFYLIIEELSQLFRSLVPIQLWYKYIMGDDPSSSYFLGGILIIMYSLCKVSTTSLTTPGERGRSRGSSTAEGDKCTFGLWLSLPRELQQLRPPRASAAKGILLPQHVGIAELGEDLRLLTSVASDS